MKSLYFSEIIFKMPRILKKSLAFSKKSLAFSKKKPRGNCGQSAPGFTCILSMFIKDTFFVDKLIF
jgi:hypothetical protein